MNQPSPYCAEWIAADASTAGGAATFCAHYPVLLSDGCRLSLPLTTLPGGDKAVALLMSNQTSFQVERNIVQRLTELVRAVAPAAIVGVPTLGLTYARPMAEAIGLPNYVALGHSRKFWYEDSLSEGVISSTSPDQSKRVYLDPALLERVQGQRVVVVDDVLNTGATMAAAIRLLRKAQAEIVAIVAVLSEGWEWHGALARVDPKLPDLVRVLGHIPIFARTPAGWAPQPETDAGARP